MSFSVPLSETGHVIGPVTTSVPPPPFSCWLRDDVAFYVGVVAYFLLVFALCLLVFILVMVQLARIKRQNPHNQSASRGVLADVRSTTGLAVLLGLSWGFALFAWGPLFLPFVYLFSIFNSLQGCAAFSGLSAGTGQSFHPVLLFQACCSSFSTAP